MTRPRRPSGPGLVYDYIVVGAGTAGCVVAARLSEDPGSRVLLLEAGPVDRNPWIHIPLGYGKTLSNPKLNWMYQSGPEPGLDGRLLSWPRGRGLGGSSSINGLLYVRGAAADYDGWAALGNPGWSHGDVVPYFRRFENHVLGEARDHGVGGPVRIDSIGWRNALSDAYIQAALETGIAANDDFNGPVQAGAGYYHQTTTRGRRVSAAVAYLRPAKKRANLDIMTGSHVSRILLEGRRSTGIAFRSGGRELTAQARREVILCAGTVGSPQILQLSGIGPAEILRNAGVEVLHDLPGVGRNLQDHYATNSTYTCRQSLTLNDLMARWTGRVGLAIDYAARRKGPLAMPAGTVGIFTDAEGRGGEPDIQISYAPFTADKFGGALHRYSAFRSSVYKMRPDSRGEIRIRSKDPATPPEIVGNYLTAESDRRTTVAALKLVRKISEAPALAPYLGQEIKPGREIQSDDEFLDYARRNGGSSFHPVGTCAMGPSPECVVDTRLRVYGIAGLRIADGSIMPRLVSGNTNAACLMIGEKGADLVRADG